jgi:hypothetical protein
LIEYIFYLFFFDSVLRLEGLRGATAMPYSCLYDVYDIQSQRGGIRSSLPDFTSFIFLYDDQSQRGGIRSSLPVLTFMGLYDDRYSLNRSGAALGLRFPI